jgi:hypothetical protein
MKIHTRSRTARKTPLMATLALACAFVAGNAGAGIPVTDVGNMGTHIMNQIQAYMNQINTYTSKIQDATHQARDYQHMMQELTQLDQVFSQMKLSFGQQFYPVPESDGVADACPGSGNLITDLVSNFGIDMNGDVVAQQRQLCMTIIVMQNKRYNDQVKAMNALLLETQQDITRQMNQISGSNTNGKMDTNATNATAGIQQILANYQQTEQRIKMYDTIITSLEIKQKRLSWRALQGSQDKSMLASAAHAAISTAVLAGALAISEGDQRCTRSGNNISCDD